MSRTHRLAALTRLIDRRLPAWPALDTAAKDLHDAAEDLPAALDRLELRLRDGLAGTSYGGTGGTGGSASPTERLLIGPLGPDEESDEGWTMSRDDAAADLARLDRALDDLTRHLRAARPPIKKVNAAARTVWTAAHVALPHKPSPKDLREVERARDDTGCEHHAAAGIYEPASHRSTVSGNLPHRMALCDPCYDQVRKKGKLPSGEWIDQHHRMGKAPRERV